MSTHPLTLKIETPRAFIPLLQPKRYKGASGGRGGAKSHFFCEKLVEDMVCEHTRAVCLREVQNSIKDSVKQLVEDKINKLGVSPLFKITDQEIIGPHDSLMIFRGMRTFQTGGGTAGGIKSLEGFTRAFFEEAQTASQRSLDLLTPTIRAPGSEILFGWNPLKPTDPIERFFAENANDPDFIHVKVNYSDNPWFPEELRRDMERDKLRDPEKYQHIWLGGYLRRSEASVFKNWKTESFETPQGVRFYHGADWGFSVDPTVLVRCWINGRTLFVDREVYQVGCDIDRTPALFDTLDPENPARRWPIRADSARPETISYMRRHGYEHIIPALKGPNSVMDGIEFLKSYDIIVHPRCKHTIDELTLYAFKTDPLTGEVLPILEDKKNHVIDALRYAVEGVRRVPPVAQTGTQRRN